MVEGTRLSGQALMDAYQFFYSGTTRIGRKKVGSMEYDPRVGHQHWHFHDFAVYELLDSGQTNPVRSGKEAFCLANTDAIDMTVKNVLWRIPIDTLSSVCGTSTSTFIRETMAVGYGDTYEQFLPGQAFDITGVPNGTYYIRITANPLGRLAEVSSANNTSLRRIVLKGSAGNHSVDVPAYEDVDSG
jgi:Lysyl oxidase